MLLNSLAEPQWATNLRAGQLSEDFLRRLQDAYVDALDTFLGTGISLWGSIDELRRNIHAALLSSDTNALRALLTFPGTTLLYYGVDELYDHGAPIGPALIAHNNSLCHEMIVSLARWLGLLRVPNPEGGMRFGAGVADDGGGVDTLLDMICAAVGTELHFPNPFAGEIGIASSRGEITVRAVGALYQAIRLKQLGVGEGVLEIGAGMGRTAFFARLLGLGRYAIVDLPLSLVGQAVFLALTLGEEQLSFASEARDTPVTLMTPSEYLGSNARWDLALNVDSIPEMDRSHASDYIARMTRDGARFLSINHEANDFCVFHVVASSHRRFRAPYMLRPGYMEELYDFATVERERRDTPGQPLRIEKVGA